MKILEGEKEAMADFGIGYVSDKIGQPQKTLKYYEKGLPILPEVGDRSEKATIAILSRLRQNFILKKFWEIEYLTIRKKLK